MSANPVPCENCGAMMNPQPDGRTYACAYCGTRVQVAVEGAQIAAGMRLDLANMEAFLSQLANTLYAGYSERTKIQAEGSVVHVIEVDLDADVFVARREGHRVVVQHKRVVRGIALRTQTLELEAWVEMLTAALANEANTSARAAWVLAQLKGEGGGPHGR